MTTTMTVTELSRVTGFSYDILKLFCDRYDMPMDRTHSGKGKHYIIDNNFKKKFEYWNKNVRVASLKRKMKNEEIYLNKLMEL